MTNVIKIYRFAVLTVSPLFVHRPTEMLYERLLMIDRWFQFDALTRLSYSCTPTCSSGWGFCADCGENSPSLMRWFARSWWPCFAWCCTSFWKFAVSSRKIWSWWCFWWRHIRNMRQNQGGSDLPSKDNNKSRSATTNGDSALRTLIEKHEWQICPDCKMSAEKTAGCLNMVCLGGGEFCYGGGERWIASGLGCPRRCGFPNEKHKRLLTTLPGTFDQLWEPLWRRFTALVMAF